MSDLIKKLELPRRLRKVLEDQLAFYEQTGEDFLLQKFLVRYTTYGFDTAVYTQVYERIKEYRHEDKQTPLN